MKIHQHIPGRTVLTMAFALCMSIFCGFLAMQNMQTSFAASTAGFNAGDIISDAVMGNYNSMSIADIQRFLTEKNPCNNRDYNLYKSYKAARPHLDWHWQDGHFVCLSEERFGDSANEIGYGQTAAEIIYYAAQDYKINPQVLIVLLQKETSLITDKVPNNNDYRKATGYGCPDTAACDSKYYGFKNQVRNAAKMYRAVLDGGWSNYPAGKTVYVQYNPNKACGGSNVYIANKATSALYRYTPYQPNWSALNAGYGAGDSCGAYGNRNFYLYFTDWFGSTHAYIDGSEVVIPDGTYGLNAKVNDNQVIEVSGRGVANGSNIQIWDRTTSSSQKMTFKRDASGYYTITDANSGKVLDLTNGSTANGTNIQLFQSNGTCAQKWRVYRTSDNYLTFESACAPGMVLDIQGGNKTNGTNVQLFLTNNSDAQKWSLYNGQVIEDGVYEFHSSLDAKNNLVMDLSNAAVHNGANIQTWSLDKRTFAQKWKIAYDKVGDFYTITNPKSGKAIDITEGQYYNKTNIQLFYSNHSCAQRWKIVRYDKDSYTLTSACMLGLAMDVSGGSANNGANLQLWGVNNSNAQHWKLTPTQLVPDHTFTIVSALSDYKAIDVYGGYTQEKTNIQLWNKNNTAAQKWKVSYDAKQKKYTITNPQSGKPLYLADKSGRAGTNVQLGKNDASCNQYWDIREDHEPGWFAFISSCNEKTALDISGGFMANGTNIQNWTRNSSLAQKWKFE